MPGRSAAVVALALYLSIGCGKLAESGDLT